MCLKMSQMIAEIKFGKRLQEDTQTNPIREKRVISKNERQTD